MELEDVGVHGQKATPSWLSGGVAAAYTPGRVLLQRSPIAIASLDRIAELAQTLAPLLEDAADAGSRRSHAAEFVVRGRGFSDSDPTGKAALDPMRRQMRDAVQRASTLILPAEDELTEAGDVIANGYLRLDREEWIRVMEKRSAALGR